MLHAKSNQPGERHRHFIRAQAGGWSLIFQQVLQNPANEQASSNLKGDVNSLPREGNSYPTAYFRNTQSQEKVGNKKFLLAVSKVSHSPSLRRALCLNKLHFFYFIAVKILHSESPGERLALPQHKQNLYGPPKICNSL